MTGEKAAGLGMSDVAFHLNGTLVRVADQPPTRTLLDWLREDRGLCGTKEGCNEGDCGACTVMVTDAAGSRALNACILFLPQLDGKAVRTVEGITGPGGEMHPVQAAMVAHHGSQCGFCTPGFVVSMAVAHLNGARDHDDQLAGNLCRCTGYAPIIRAAEAAESEPAPDWMTSDSAFILAQVSRGMRAAPPARSARATATNWLSGIWPTPTPP
jgi:xanthine dehydrogenase small subunit